MGAIFYRQFSEGLKPYLTLAGEEWVRPLGIGSNWSRVMMVISCAVTPNGTSNITGVHARIGFCSGTERTLGSSSPLNGLMFHQRPERNLVYNAGPPAYFSLNSNPAVAKVVNGVVNDSGSTVNMTYGLTGKRSVIGVGIVKGSPNYSVFYFYTQAAGFASDVTNLAAIEALDIMNLGGGAATWVMNGVTYSVYSNYGTIAFDEVAGPLDTANIFWPKANFPLEIYGIYIARYA